MRAHNAPRRTAGVVFTGMFTKLIVCSMIFGFYCPLVTLAETIFLKSGQSIEGKIVEKSDECVKIDFYGVILTYYFDEIKTIDGIPLSISPKDEKVIIPKQKSYDMNSLPQEQRNKLADLSERSMLCFNQDDMECAIAGAQEMLKIDSSFPLAYLLLGEANCLRGRLEEAFPYLSKIPESEEFFLGYKLNRRLSAAYSELALIYSLVKKDDETAKAYLKRATEIDPLYTFAHFTLGALHKKRGDSEALAGEINKLRGLGDYVSAKVLEEGSGELNVVDAIQRI